MCGIVQVPGERQNGSALRHHQPQQAGRRLTGAVVVHADEAQAFAAGCICVQRDDRDAPCVQFINALPHLRRGIRRQRDALHAHRHQFFYIFEHQFGIKALKIAKNDLYTRACKLLGGLKHACTHDLHGRGFVRLNDNAQLEVLASSHERLTD